MNPKSKRQADADACLRGLAVIEQKLDDHIVSSDLTRQHITHQLDTLSTDVQSLLLSRSFTRGIIRMAMIVSAAISALISFVGVYITWRQ